MTEQKRDVYQVSRRMWNRRNVFLNSPQEPYKHVYRFEDSEGRGPYRTDAFTFRQLSWRKVVKKSPIHYLRPDQDFHFMYLMGLGFWDTKRRENLYFGFSSVSQIHKWFDKKVIDALRADGFVLKRKKAAVVVASDVQCIFVPYTEDASFYWRPAILKW